MYFLFLKFRLKVGMSDTCERGNDAVIFTSLSSHHFQWNSYDINMDVGIETKVHVYEG